MLADQTARECEKFIRVAFLDVEEWNSPFLDLDRRKDFTSKDVLENMKSSVSLISRITGGAILTLAIILSIGRKIIIANDMT